MTSHADSVRRLRAREEKALIMDAMQRARQEAEFNDGHVDESKGFGKKSIGFWGSVCLNLNNCMGPAMVLLPLLNQQAGWFTPTLAMIVVWALSSLAATMLCEAMQRIPGNFFFEHRYEFATVVRHYYGRGAYIAFQVFFNLSLQASNIAAMVISAQVMDTFIRKITGGNYAFQYQLWPPSFEKMSDNSDYPWCHGHVDTTGCNGTELTFVISIGFLICMAICIPFGYLNLDENMWFQWFSLVGLIVFTFEFFGQFIYNFGRDDKLCIDEFEYNQTCNYHPHNPEGNYTHNGFDRTPFATDSLVGHSQVLGIAIFAYAYIVTIPSWVNEKRHHVNINKAVWFPASVGLVLKLLTGLLGAWAYWLVQPSGKQRDYADNILNILLLPNQPKVTQYSAYLWDITTLIPGIPVLAIMVRYNLLSGNVCGRFWSFFWGVVAPWIVTLFFYEESLLLYFANWVAIVVQGFINFVIPAMLYRTALKRYPDHMQPPHLSVASAPPGIVPTVDDDGAEADETSRLSEGHLNKFYSSVELNGDHDDEEEAFPEETASDSELITEASSLLNSAISAEKTKAMLQEVPVNAIPRFIVIFGRVIFIDRVLVADIMIWFFSILSGAVIVFSAVVDGMGLQ